MGEERGTAQRLAQVEQRLAAVEARLAQLEHVRTRAPADRRDTEIERESQVEAGDSAPERAHPNTLLHRLAVASFALVGALLLRTATRQQLIGAGVGTALGLAYCTLLLLGPLAIERARGPWAHARMLQISGALLVPVILFEMVVRNGALTLTVAAFVIGVAMAAVALLAWWHRSAGLAASTVALVAAIAALGASAAGAEARAAVLVESCAAALWLAHTRGWSVLRAFVVLPSSALLALALIITARRPELAALAPVFALAQLAVLALVLGSNALRARDLGRFERVLAPALLIWTFALMQFLSPRIASVGGAVFAALLLVTALLLPAGRAWSKGALASATLSGALLAGAAFPFVDRSGVALAAAALVAQHLSCRRGVVGATAWAQLLAVGAATSCVWRGALLERAVGAAWLWVGVGLALVVLLVASFALALTRRDGDDTAGQSDSSDHWVVAPTLVSLAVVAYGTLQLAVSMIVHDAQLFAVSRGVIIAALAIGTLILGRVRQLAIVSYLGIAGIVVLLGKVVTIDMVRLEGGYAVASVMTLGVAATATSIVLKRTAPRKSDTVGEDEPQ